MTLARIAARPHRGSWSLVSNLLRRTKSPKERTSARPLLGLVVDTVSSVGYSIGTVRMSRRRKVELGFSEKKITEVFSASQAMNSKLQSRGRESGVTICPLCKKRNLHYSRCADNINFDGRCMSPGCGFSWGF
jgi:hypothetical protein